MGIQSTKKRVAATLLIASALCTGVSAASSNTALARDLVLADTSTVAVYDMGEQVNVPVAVAGAAFIAGAAVIGHEAAYEAGKAVGGYLVTLLEVAENPNMIDVEDALTANALSTDLLLD
jgi:hypothetical protein